MADVSTINTPQQKALYDQIAPIIQRMSQFGTGTGAFGPGGNLYQQPMFQIPQYPSMGQGFEVPGFQGGVPGYQGGVTNYPSMDIGNMLPTQDFFQNIAPEMRQGYDYETGIAQENLMNTLGSHGQLGSQRGGISGASGAALGEFHAQRASNFGQNAYNMAFPAMSMGFQQEANRLGTMQGQGENRQLQLQGQQESRLRGQQQQGFMSNQMGFGQEAGRLGTLQGQAYNQAASPFNMLPGMIGQGMPTSTVTPEGSSSSDQLMSALTMAAMFYGLS